MAIEITETSHVATVWYMEIPQPRGNMLAVVMHNGDGKWYGRYRLRWYRDEKIFNSADARSWVDLKTKNPTPQDLVDGLDRVVALLAAGSGGQVERLDINMTGAAALEAMYKMSWCHLEPQREND